MEKLFTAVLSGNFNLNLSIKSSICHLFWLAEFVYRNKNVGREVSLLRNNNIDNLQIKFQ